MKKMLLSKMFQFLTVLKMCGVCGGRRILRKGDGWIRCEKCKHEHKRIVLPGGARWTKRRHKKIKAEVDELYLDLKEYTLTLEI